MRRVILETFFGPLVAATALVVACGDLPSTSAPLPPDFSGGTGGGNGGVPSASGGKAGTPDSGGSSGSSAGGTSGGTGGGTGGTESNAGEPGSGGSAGSAGASGKGGAGGTGGSGAEGGVPEPGEAGMGAGATGGAGGSSGSGGSAGSAGGSAGSFSTNPDDFFGDSRCASDLDLCEDFESGEFDDDTWELAGTTQPEVDDTRAARGDYSAHFHTVDNGLSMIRTRAIFPAEDNTYFGRMFVYFDSMPTAPSDAHWTVSGAQGPDDEELEIRVGGQYDNAINRFGVGTDHGPTGDWTNLDEDPGDPVPVRSWVCLEWMHKGDTNETRFYWNGVERPSLYTSATEHGGDDVDYELPAFESVWFGWWLYQDETDPGEFDVWIDEIALDATRIGCSK